MTSSIGVDIGGTKTLGVLLSEDGTVLAERRIDTSQDRHLLLQSMKELVADFGSDGSVGLGIPGTVRNQREVVKAPNLPCFDGLTSSDLADSLGRPVTIGNDAKCAALAEWKLGAGVGARHLVLVTVGTGIGVGIGAERYAQGPQFLSYLFGAAEGTEQISFSLLCCLFPDAFRWIALVFAGICFVSTAARSIAGWRAFT